MYTSTLLTALVASASTASAFQLPSLNTATSNLKRSVSTLFSRQYEASCPPAWSNISTVLTAQFLADGQCTDGARAAIRAAFHDCFNGACDGSLILADECSNSENAGLGMRTSEISRMPTVEMIGRCWTTSLLLRKEYGWLVQVKKDSSR